MMTENKRIIAYQQELIHKLSWNDGFGCHTRAGLVHVVWPDIGRHTRSLLVFVINGMHALIEKLGGDEPVDAMIMQVLAVVRSTDYVCGQVKSGDEFTDATT